MIWTKHISCLLVTPCIYNNIIYNNVNKLWHIDGCVLKKLYEVAYCSSKYSKSVVGCAQRFRKKKYCYLLKYTRDIDIK